MKYTSTSISIEPVIGGFIVTYPVYAGNGSDDVVVVQEVATTMGKAMRIAKAAVADFSLVGKEE